MRNDSRVCGDKIKSDKTLIYDGEKRILYMKIPILAVLGHKSSGKTTIIERISSEMSKTRLKVATAKHVSQKDFTIDIRGSDTWHHKMAGADPIFVVSEHEFDIITKDGDKGLTIEKIADIAEEYGANLLLLEGFSSLVLEEHQVGKIICLRNTNEKNKFKSLNTIAYCSLQQLDENILKIPEDIPLIVKDALTFVEKRKKISKIYKKLAGLDCGKCRKRSCLELAEDIYTGKSKIEDCKPLRIKSTLKTKIKIRNKELPLQHFTSEIIRKTILTMISTLKGTEIEGDEEVQIEIIQTNRDKKRVR